MFSRDRTTAIPGVNPISSHRGCLRIAGISTPACIAPAHLLRSLAARTGSAEPK
ncbi:hypothetical protein C7S14_7966 [Burkholderia cepacia]|nr:hypothetical protein C7S14_7966 [Burkholderia cepacia]